MQPATGPGQPQPVLPIGLGVGEPALQCRVHPTEVAPPGYFALHNNIARLGRHQSTHQLLAASEQIEHEGRSHRRIATEVKVRQHHPPISFPTNHRANLQHGLGDVGFSHRGPYDLDIERPRGIIHHERGREIGRYRPSTLFQDTANSESESIILSNRRPRFIYEGQPVDVGVDGDAEIGSGLPHRVLKQFEISRYWLRRP